MTMLSAQPTTLTGEQHQRFWSLAKRLREHVNALAGPEAASAEVSILLEAGEIERILIDAQDAAPPATASSGEAA